MDDDVTLDAAPRAEAWRSAARAGVVLLVVGVVLDLVVGDLLLSLQGSLGGGRATGYTVLAYAVRAVTLVSIPTGAALVGAAVVLRALLPARRDLGAP